MPPGITCKRVRDDAGADQQLALGVVVDAPRIAEPVRDHLETILGRVIAPHAAVDLHAVARQQIARERLLRLVDPSLAFGLPDLRVGGVSLQSVEPAVGPPVQAVDRLVAIGDAPAGEAHFDVGHVGLVVAVAVGDEQQIRRRAEEQAIESDGDRRGKRDALEEDLAAVGDAVAVGVFENQDAAVAGIREALRRGTRSRGSRPPTAGRDRPSRTPSAA